MASHRVTTGLLLSLAALVGGEASADVRYCDSASENCRTELIRLIRAETQGIYTIQWYTRDTAIVSELIKRHQAGVPVRFIMDLKSENTTRSGVLDQVYALRDAGIPMRHGPSKYIHGKAFIFVGQRVMQFGAPNLSAQEWLPTDPFKNYRNENNEFHYQTSLVDSFMTIYENFWASNTYLRDYANMTDALRARAHPLYPKDPRFSIQPMDAFSSRLLKLIDAEKRGIDVNVLRFDSLTLADAIIRRHHAGLPIRVNTETSEYRSVNRPMVSYVLDTLHAAGVPLKWRAHNGNNHEKVAIFHGQQVVVRGSSNWSPGSDRSGTNIEVNLFSNPLMGADDLEAYLVYSKKFERRWSNLQFVDGVRVTESKAFAPLQPGGATYLAPANGSSVTTDTPSLKFKVQFASNVDVYYGRSSTTLMLHTSAMPVQPLSTVTVTLPPLAPGTYYWRVVSRTAANRTSTSSIWSFQVK